jgi:hypothetical protein
MSNIPENFIYVLIDPRTGAERYVGASSEGMKRPNKHRAPSVKKKNKAPVYRWIRELESKGFGFIISVVERLESPINLGAREDYWIDKLRAEGADLLNCKVGGGKGFSGRHHSPEARERIRAALKGKPKSSAMRKLLSDATKGHAVSEDARAKLSRAHGGRPVRILAPDGSERICSTLAECARELQVSTTTLRRALGGQTSAAFPGLTLSYADNA